MNHTQFTITAAALLFRSFSIAREMAVKISSTSITDGNLLPVTLQGTTTTTTTTTTAFFSLRPLSLTLSIDYLIMLINTV